MSRSGISSFTGNNKAEEAHPTLKKGKLSKKFSVPSISDFASNGDFSVQLSGPINVYDPLEGRRLSSSGDLSEEQNIAVMQSWLKLTDSLKLQLIPGNDMYTDKKGFKWQLKSYSEKSMDYKVTFEHPNYISVGDPDTLKVVFNNTSSYLAPQAIDL